MARFTARAGDRLLGVFLGKADAGACVPEHGQYCRCGGHCVYRYDCYGACKYSAPCNPC